MYRSITRGISVTVKPEFMQDRSSADDARFFWAYTIEIVNESRQEVQLLTRHWIITDGEGRVQEVRGEGVVGEQPTLPPGGSYTYTSGCPLTTPHGSMEGSYGMVDDAGQSFEVAIPLFALDSPYVHRTIH